MVFSASPGACSDDVDRRGSLRRVGRDGARQMAARQVGGERLDRQFAVASARRGCRSPCSRRLRCAGRRWPASGRRRRCAAGRTGSAGRKTAVRCVLAVAGGVAGASGWAPCGGLVGAAAGIWSTAACRASRSMRLDFRFGGQRVPGAKPDRGVAGQIAVGAGQAETVQHGTAVQTARRRRSGCPGKPPVSPPARGASPTATEPTDRGSARPVRCWRRSGPRTSAIAPLAVSVAPGRLDADVDRKRCAAWRRASARPAGRSSRQRPAAGHRACRRHRL